VGVFEFWLLQTVGGFNGKQVDDLAELEYHH